MIEIEKIEPFYICNMNRDCNIMPTCGGDDCIHTTIETYAKSADAVMIYNLFCDTFRCYVSDDYGKLIIVEKEKADDKK